MSTIATFIVVLFFAEFCSSTFGTNLRLKDSEDESNALVSVGRTLEQTASRRTTAQEDERVGMNCSEAILGADLQLCEGEALRNSTTANITACCEECQSTENCTAFRRNRSSGACELFSCEVVYYEFSSNSDFDIEGMVGSEVSPESSEEGHPKSIAIPPPAPVPDCRITRGVTYPNGEVLMRRYRPTAMHCCEACRASRDCNSWYYNNRNRRCILNRDIPSATEADSSRFRGGTSLDYHQTFISFA